MTETIRYSLIGAQDIKFGTDSFEVQLADGRVVVLEAIHAGHLPSASGGKVQDYIADLVRARRGLGALWDFDQNDATTTGLTWGYTKGMKADGTVQAAGTVTLTANATNYVQWNPTDSSMAVNISGFTPSTHVPIRKLVTSATAITANTDSRPIWRSNVSLVQGQCILTYVSATAIRLDPYNGNRIIIDGTVQTIANAGVTLANTGLSASTLYNVYVYMSGSTMTLEASTTGTARDTTTGVQIKSADSTRTFVGSVRTDGSSNFLDSAAQRFPTVRDTDYAGMQRWAKGADVASAAALAPGSDGNAFDVTGTTGITSLPNLQAGTILILQFDGALTLTHNATSLVLANAIDLTTVAGDMLMLISEGAGNWRELGRGLTTAPLGRKGADIASAAALNLGQDGDFFDVTGTTTITSIESRPAGFVVTLQFDGALTLTHNATTLILQGSVNLATAAGDVITLISEGAGNWREKARRLAAAATSVSAATQAEMEAASSTTVYASPGRTQYHPGVTKAWGNAQGDGLTLSANRNVSSIVDEGIGYITWNFSTVFSTADYAAIAGNFSPGAGPLFSHVVDQTAALVRTQTRTTAGTLTDPTEHDFVVFGDQ
jgi:hypothetical protein